MSRRAATLALLVPLLLCAGVVLAVAAWGHGPQEPVVLRVFAPRPVAGGAALLVGTFALLLVLPFVPGLIEVYWPRDTYPLPIDTGYVKDPRYLGRSLRRIMTRALQGTNGRDGRHRVTMSRQETVEVFHELTLAAGQTTDLVLHVRGDLQTGRDVTLQRDAWVHGAASLGAGNRLRTLACDGDLSLGEGSVVIRWLDAEGELTVGRNCRLGAHTACGGRLLLDDGCRFQRLYGLPVVTLREGATAPIPEPPLARPVLEVEEILTVEDMTHWHRGDLTIHAGEELRRPLVVKGELTCEAGSVLPFAAAADSRLSLGAGVVVHGDLFCDGPVEVGPGCIVKGNIFSQDTVRLVTGVRVGTPAAPKSVIGKKGVRLAGNVVVHGYVQTDGWGEVRCDAAG